MHREEPGHRTEGVVQDGSVGGSVKGLTDKRALLKLSEAVEGSVSAASKN